MMQSGRVHEIESAAAAGKEIPEDLSPPDTMLYYMLLGLYACHRAGQITAEQGEERKKSIMNVYKRVKDDYEQYTDICKEYQRCIREETIMHYKK